MIDKQSLLDRLGQQIIRDNVCPELASQASQLVLGSGSPEAEMVFIGEAPGKKEDEQGKPFVGAAGRFLDEMLRAADLNRDDVYITNIVKYRPPNNRDPLPEEKEAFWPYLIKQIEIINPKVIITLGRHSGSAFIENLRISSDHGKARTVSLSGREYLLIPLYHPAAALYNGGMRQVLIDDFLATVRLIEAQAKD